MIQQQAFDVAPGENSYQRDTVTSAEIIALPADMLDRFCTFAAVGEDVAIRFGDASVSVDMIATSTLTGDTLTEDATTPHMLIPAGQERPLRLAADRWTHFAHVSAATGGRLLFGNTTGTGS